MCQTAFVLMKITCTQIIILIIKAGHIKLKKKKPIKTIVLISFI